MATRRQIHIAVAHQHDNDGCKICHNRFGESGSGGDGARTKLAGSSGTSTPARSDSRRGSSSNTLASSSLETGSLPALPRFPRSLSDPNTFQTLGMFGDIANLAFRPRSANARHTYVFSADFHPATSPRTHHHHNASLSTAQLAAHAFGPPAEGYDFGDEGGVRPWPECEQDSPSTPVVYAQPEGRKKRRRSKLRYDVSESAGVDEFFGACLPSPATSLERSKSTSSSNGAYTDESSSSSGPSASLDVPSEDSMETSPTSITQSSSPVNEVRPPFSSAVIRASSSAPTVLQDTSGTRKRKRRSFRFRSSYHALLRSEMMSPPLSCCTTTSSTPSLMPSSPDPSTSSSSISQSLSSSPPNSQMLGYSSDPPLSISELDLFGAGSNRYLVDWGSPPPSSIQELKRTWTRSERAPLPPRVRRLQKLLQLEQRQGAERLDPTVLAKHPTSQFSSPVPPNEDVEMASEL
ncbi:hypothetical protein SCHPADRAFT_946889 [Schizopora paradoxa]|uniref:Uncharacterized protein n=1 Tax=Schizopora paradoxa TaxID=27342 RepID=A0A0H2RKZ2_9AGAM|nr:hypothetical protein SCHPADRAFT_946889 [Schizopora paradoxa]